MNLLRSQEPLLLANQRAGQVLTAGHASTRRCFHPDRDETDEVGSKGKQTMPDVAGRLWLG